MLHTHDLRASIFTNGIRFLAFNLFSAPKETEEASIFDMGNAYQCLAAGDLCGSVAVAALAADKIEPFVVIFHAPHRVNTPVAIDDAISNR